MDACINRPTVSVCMASYNGSDFINQQINSILPQLNDDDELIIVDDCSVDRTVELINEYDDKRIKFFVNDTNVGHVRSFERAIRESEREFIFLSDQDDIWPPDRLRIMVDAGASNSSLVIGAFRDFFSEPNVSAGSTILYNAKNNLRILFDFFAGKLPILGCVMCFPSSDKKLLIPFPRAVYAHDIYIFQYFFRKRRFRFISDLVLYHRIHSKNVTPRHRRPFLVVAYSRLLLLFVFIMLIFK